MEELDEEDVDEDDDEDATLLEAIAAQKPEASRSVETSFIVVCRDLWRRVV